ncbi:MAG: methionyl-tRNA formyltransferase [Pseudomonadota bacterium]
MRIVFMGTPEFAVPVLDALVAAGHEIVAAYSQPPRRGNRGKVAPSPVQVRAEALGIPVRTPLTLRDAEAQAEFAAFGADVAVVAAYGLILPKPVLAAPRLGCLNVHGSNLPRWRGAAPIQRAILAGDAETGVGIMQMEAGLDTGPVLLEEKIEIGAYDTTGVLSYRLSHIGAGLMVKVLANPEAYPPRPQSDVDITYANKIDKAEARIDWTKGAEFVDRQIRAFNPTPGAWFEYHGERIRILTARIQSAPNDPTYRTDFPAGPGVVLDDQLAIGCGSGAIRPDMVVPEKVQRAGRGVMTADELLRGFPIPPGTQL